MTLHFLSPDCRATLRRSKPVIGHLMIHRIGNWSETRDDNVARLRHGQRLISRAKMLSRRRDPRAVRLMEIGQAEAAEAKAALGDVKQTRLRRSNV